MSAIPLNDFLGDLDPAECKLHCAVWNQEEQPIDVLARSWEDEWVGWNSWRPTKDEFNRRLIFSLAQMVYDHPTHWLFGGGVRGGRPASGTTHVLIRRGVAASLGAYVKRLQVGFELPERNIRLKMEKYLSEMSVVAILPEPYAGEPFPGLDGINHTLSQLDVVFDRKRADWRYALEPMKGVYVIHDRATGKAYVGSACGDTGIWERWGNYVDSLHGGNALLRELVGRRGESYARENLVFALLSTGRRRLTLSCSTARTTGSRFCSLGSSGSTRTELGVCEAVRSLTSPGVTAPLVYKQQRVVLGRNRADRWSRESAGSRSKRHSAPSCPSLPTARRSRQQVVASRRRSV